MNESGRVFRPVESCSESGGGRGAPSSPELRQRLQDAEVISFIGTAVDDMDAAGNAGVKGVNGAQDFHGTLWIGNRRADERFFHCAALALCVTRAEVPCGGTTSWKLAILPSSITIQCERPPRGALTKPTPRPDFGTSQFSTILLSPLARLSLSSSSHTPV